MTARWLQEKKVTGVHAQMKTMSEVVLHVRFLKGFNEAVLKILKGELWSELEAPWHGKQAFRLDSGNPPLSRLVDMINALRSHGQGGRAP